MDFKLLMELRQYLSVAHHVPGRIRVKFSLKLLGDPRAKKAMDQAGTKNLPPAVYSTRLNPLGRSVVIEYDPEAVDPNALAELLTTSDNARFEELAKELKEVLLPEQV